MSTADLTVLALGRQELSASEYIAEIQRRLRKQERVRFQMHAMGTSLEGTTEDILAVVGELHSSRSSRACSASTPCSSSTSAATAQARRSRTRCAASRTASATTSRASVQVAGAAQEALQRGQEGGSVWRDVEVRAAFELAAPGR